MFLAVILIFFALIFLGVMGHISKATDVGCAYVTLYTIGWIGSLIWLCCQWSHLHGFWETLGAMLIAFFAPFIIHLALLILKGFVIWALKGLGD